MEVSWFFLSGFFCIFFAFDDDVGTYFKEVVIGKKKFFVA